MTQESLTILEKSINYNRIKQFFNEKSIKQFTALIVRMKQYQKSIYTSSIISFLAVASSPWGPLWEQSLGKPMMATLIVVGITLLYLLVTLYLINMVPESEKYKFGLWNPVVNSIVMVMLFSSFFLMEQIQDFLFYSLGMEVRYIQSPWFTMIFPALLFFGMGMIGHAMIARKSI